MLITSVFGNIGDKLLYRQTFHTSLNNSTYLFLKLSLTLKVMVLPQPEKLQKIAKNNHN